MSGAILFDHPGEPNVLHWKEVEALQPRPHEVVIRVEASPINPSDLGLLFGAADMTTATAGAAVEFLRRALV